LAGYPLDPGQIDETFTEAEPPSVREHYTHVVDFFRELTRQDLARLHGTIDSLLREQGITFSLLADEDGLERTLPLDLVPRVISAQESENLVHLVPADGGEQRRLAFALTVRPQSRIRAYDDHWGNAV
jgi:uncharacterized circularly permuted ATP-grasp superfamily protein